MFEGFKEFVESIQMRAYEDSQLMTPEQEEFNAMLDSESDMLAASQLMPNGPACFSQFCKKQM